jgi:hypothetical protein
MSNPGVFGGFSQPKENWSKLPNALIDALPLFTSEAELKVVLYVLRHTWGYHDEDKRISIDEFSRGRKKRGGLRIDTGCGLTDNTIKDGLRRAIQHGFIDVEENTRDSGRITRFYRLKMKEIDDESVGSEVDPPDMGGQKLTPVGSEVDPVGSEVDPRSEKETNRKTPGEETYGAPVRPRPRDELFDAICEVCRVDAKTAGATVGKLKSTLVKATYTAEDVRKFGELWWSDEFRKRRNIPPTVWQLVERIGVVRTAPGAQPTIQGTRVDCNQGLTPAKRAILISREREKANPNGNV